MQYDAVILAGGESSSELKQIAPYDNEALIVIGNYPMVYYVYHALRQSENIGKIVISGPVDPLRNIFVGHKNLYLANSGNNAVESFFNAIKLLKETGISDRILVMPTDIPFITCEAIDDFIKQSEENDAEFYYSVTSQQVNDSKFPGVARTYVKLKEGVFTGGNLFIVDKGILPKVEKIALQLVERRKKPLAMARLFGFGLVWKYITGRLSVEAAEKRFFEVVGLRGKAIISPYAEVGVDVDKPSDLELAQKYLSKVSF
ncbi:MAG: nucleotidyltransferase family protein [Syntrophomonadaceae bacterium]